MSENENKGKQKEQGSTFKEFLGERWPYALFVLVFSFILYGNTVPNEYAIDDPIVTNNELTQQGIKGIPEIFTSHYRVTDEYNYGYRPIAKSTFALEHELFGSNPHIGHFINVLIYALIGVFLLFILSKLFRGYHLLFPFITTILFIAHPIHTEAVASLKNREELLSFFGCLVSLHFFIKYAANKKAYTLLLGLLFYVFAFLSKQNAIAFLAVIPLCLYYFTDTVFHLQFLKTAVEILTPIAARIKRLLLRRSTLLFAGLLCYFPSLFLWNDEYFGYSVLLLLPAIFFFQKAYLTSNPSLKPFVKLLFTKPSFWALAVLYGLIVAVRHSIYLEQQVINIVYHVLGLLGAVFVFKYFYQNFSTRLGVKRGAAKFYVAIVALFIYVYPLFSDLLRQNIVAGLIPIVLYFFPAVSSEESRESLRANEVRIPSSGLQLPDFIASISQSTKLFILLVVVLGLASYAAVFAPNEYLGPEQRELHYFENPLFYVNEWWLKIATALYSLFIYIKLLILPHPLVFYYGFNHVPIVDFSNGWVLLSIGVHLSLLAYALRMFRKKHIMSFAILYYLITIFIYSNLVVKIPGIVGERLLFMPSLGFCIALAFFAFKILKIEPKSSIISNQTRKRLLFVIALLVVPYSIKTIARNQDWKNHTTLYLHDIPYLENSLHANALVASHILKGIPVNPQGPSEVAESERQIKLVVKHFEQVLKLDPNSLVTLNNLAMVYYGFFKNYQKAETYYRRAYLIDKTVAITSFNLGYCNEQMGKLELAKSAYLKALSIDEKDVKSMANLANVYFNLGRKDSAVFINEELTRIDPKLDLPYINMGNYYLQMNREVEAVEMFERAVELNSDNAQLVAALIEYFKSQGNQQKVVFYTKLSAQSF